jgi:ELWxxDGT repeat protein
MKTFWKGLTFPTLLLLATALAAASAASAASAAPSLIADLNRGPAAYVPTIATEGLTDASGNHYFAAGDPAHGLELWRSDGTAAGTVRLTDICPGPCASGPVPMALLHGRVYFLATDGASGAELWSSGPEPGDSMGSERLGDLCPGPCPGGPANIATLGDTLYFVGFSAPGHVALFASDGTAAGTRPVREICADCTSLAYVHVFRGQIFFTAPGLEFWVSDGTAAGTIPVRQRFAGRPFPLDPNVATSAAFDEERYFFTTPDKELWVSDLTPAGTHLVRDLLEILPDYQPAWVPSILKATFRDGRLFARLDRGELIASDGTHDGTILLRTSTNSFSLDLLNLPAAVLVVDGTDAIRATTGTPESTVEIFDVHGGQPGNGDSIDSIAKIGDLAFFTVLRRGDGFHPTSELWVSDGTAAGTRRIRSAPDAIESFSPPVVPTPVPGPFYFIEGTNYSGTVLWRSDGTEAGTFAVHDFGDVPAGSGPLAQGKLGNRLIFSARTSPTSVPLFATDGTAAGTRVLSTAAQRGQDFFRLDGQLLFDTVTPASAGVRSSRGLWRTDGTAAGTRLVSARGLLTSPTVLGAFVLYGDARTFSEFGQPETELFRTDGTPGGTRLVANIDRFRIDTGFHHSCYGASSDPGPGVVVRNRVVFADDDGVHGRELWASDGTARGTVLLKDTNPRRDPAPPPSCGDENDPRRDTGLPSDPEELLAFRGGALFTADDGVSGRELWITDGTSAGTRRVRDIRPGLQGSNPHDLVLFRGKAYFFAATGATGSDTLWQTDGTAAGTARVSDLALDGFPSWASRLTAVGSHLFFAAYNPATGSELWMSGGDAGSTHLLADLHPGPPGAAPQALTDVQGILVFAADDGASGLEPWRSDGTAAGTRRLGDLNPGEAASSPGPFDVAGSVLVTGADDGTHGREPWAIPLSEILTP